MAWSVVVFFDSPSEARIRGLWQRLRTPYSDAILYEPGSRPHVTLSILEEQDGSLEARMAAVAAATDAFSLTFSALGHFPGSGVLYMAPRPSAALQALYRRSFAALGPLQGALWPHYLPGKWVPHTTVAMDTDESEIRRTLRRAHGVFAPFSVPCLSVGVVKFRPVALSGEYALRRPGRD